MELRLENWAITYTDQWDGYTAPELRDVGIVGEVHGDPKRRDGSLVRIGTPVKIQGRLVTTKRNTYRLGRVSTTYRAYLKEHRPNWDPENPLDGVDL